MIIGGLFSDAEGGFKRHSFLEKKLRVKEQLRRLTVSERSNQACHRL